jgi:hypothetical protein
MNRRVRSGVGDGVLVTGAAFSGLVTGVWLGFLIWRFI